MAIEISKNLVGKWPVYYGASGAAVYYGELIDVNEKDKEMKIINELTSSSGYLNDRNCVIFETKEQAVEEYESYQGGDYS